MTREQVQSNMTDSPTDARDRQDRQDDLPIATEPNGAILPSGSAEAANNVPPAASPCDLAQILNLDQLALMQDNFAKVTRLKLSVVDAQGNPLLNDDNTFANPNCDGASSTLPAARMPLMLPASKPGPDGKYTVPIIIDGKTIGSFVMEPSADAPIDNDAAVQLLYLWANGITRVAYQEHELRQRMDELETLYKLSTLLSAHRNLQELLDAAAKSAADVLKVKASSIRLLDEAGKELIPSAVYNLSIAYLNKGPILIDQSDLYRETLAGNAVWVENMANDPRVLYPEDAQREGVVSNITAPMIYQGKPIGVVRLYTAERRKFSDFDISLVKAVAQICAAAIVNARMDADRIEALRVQRQLRLATDVQRRMLPAEPPIFEPFEIAARYVPSFELGGDFYDFIPLDGHLGVAVGDAVGKGIAASLLMASVRAFIRAYSQDVYDIDEIVSRVNIQLEMDTLDNEFATLFYGVLDPTTLRLTYCSAGHEPTLLLRDGQLSALTTGGMIVGIDPDQEYEKGIVQLKKNDLLLIYSDGLPDAFNFAQQKFGRQRIIDAMHEAAKGNMSAKDAMNHVLWQMRRFAGLRTNNDDLTLVMIKVAGDAIPKAIVNTSTDWQRHKAPWASNRKH